MKEDITPEQALELILPLKPSEFIKGVYTNGKDKCCIMGHLARLTSNDPIDYSQRNCSAILRDDLNDLRTRSKKLFKDKYFSSLASINNGEEKKYQQKTIKGRVVAALKDLIKLEKL